MYILHVDAVRLVTPPPSYNLVSVQTSASCGEQPATMNLLHTGLSGESRCSTNTHFEGLTMSAYQNDIKAVAALKAAAGSSWSAIDPESVARMRAQNRFKTGLEMAEYNADSSVYTQSLGCWHGFIGQQKLISIKKHLKTTNKRYLYLSGWMVAALRSDFGPLPDQSMHEKTAVSDLIEELYTFLRQADARELDLLFTALDAAREAGDSAKAADIQNQIDNYETHIVPIIADIDAGFD